MWRLVIASESHAHELCEDEEVHGIDCNTPVADNLAGHIDASPIAITTTKVSIYINFICEVEKIRKMYASLLSEHIH